MYKITTECIGCGACAEECEPQAIQPQGDIFVIIPEKCIECGVCVDSCPVASIIQE